MKKDIYKLDLGLWVVGNLLIYVVTKEDFLKGKDYFREFVKILERETGYRVLVMAENSSGLTPNKDVEHEECCCKCDDDEDTEEDGMEEEEEFELKELPTLESVVDLFWRPWTSIDISFTDEDASTITTSLIRKVMEYKDYLVVDYHINSDEELASVLLLGR